MSKFSYEDIYDFSKVVMFDLKEKIKDGKYVSATSLIVRSYCL